MLFTIVLNGLAQNLVPNPSFEDTIQCPISLNEVGSLVGWTGYGNTPDYFHTCHTLAGLAGVPSNYYGFQQPRSGKGYCGMLTYTFSGSAREPIGVNLVTPLIIGQKYYASAYVCMANCSNQSGYGSNKLGFIFTNTSYSSSNPIPISNFAHIYSDSIITDTLNWIQIFGSFIADSTYSKFAFGNFFDDLSTDTINTINCVNQLAYYYIDDICISTDSNYCTNWTGVTESYLDNSQIKVFPNPTKDIISIFSQEKIEAIQIINSMGQVIYIDNTINKNKIEVSMGKFNKGIYFIRIKENNKIHNSKILLTH